MLRHQHDLKGAAAACREAIRLDENYDEAWLNLGSYLHHLGRPDEAEAALTRAVELDSEFANTVVRLLGRPI